MKDFLGMSLVEKHGFTRSKHEQEECVFIEYTKEINNITINITLYFEDKLFKSTSVEIGIENHFQPLKINKMQELFTLLKLLE